MAKSYENAGVNLEAGYEVVRRIKQHVASTKRQGSMGNIGSFGGMFDLSALGVKEPVLVSSVGASGGFETDGRPSVYRRALNLIEQNRIDIAPLITHRYTSFADVEKALSSDIHVDDYVKGVVVL